MAVIFFLNTAFSPPLFPGSTLPLLLFPPLPLFLPFITFVCFCICFCLSLSHTHPFSLSAGKCDITSCLLFHSFSLVSICFSFGVILFPPLLFLRLFLLLLTYFSFFLCCLNSNLPLVYKQANILTISCPHQIKRKKDLKEIQIKISNSLSTNLSDSSFQKNTFTFS